MKTIVVILGMLFVLWGLAACGPTDVGPTSVSPTSVGLIDIEATAVPPNTPFFPGMMQQAMAEQDGVFVILTLTKTLDEALAQQFEAAGIRLFDPLGDYRFQAYVPQTAVSTLALWQAERHIVSVEAIDPITKIKGSFIDPAEHYAIVVHFYTEPTEAETAVLASQMQVERTAVGVMNFVEGQATGAQIEGLSALPFVKAIEEAVVSSGG
jgi:hypothetical protein